MSYRYKLNDNGKVGAFLFVAPTPLSLAFCAVKASSIGGTYEEAAYLASANISLISRVMAKYMLDMVVIGGVAATITLIGLVLVIVGRDLVPIPGHAKE